VYLFLTPLGYAITDDEFRIVERILFPKIPSEVAKEYLTVIYLKYLKRKK